MNAMLSKAFDPTADAAAFRGALGSFATGVTVVTAHSADEGPVAIVANSFASVSLDPPLVLWSPAKASRRFPYFATAPHFNIHVLAASQRDVCETVLRSMTAVDSVPMQISPNGTPIIEGALATFECSLEASHDAGDHVIVVGRVINAHHRAGTPLVFHGGGYCALQQVS